MDGHPIPYHKLIDYAAGDLTGQQLATVEAHVATCLDCAFTVGRYRTVRRIVRTDDSEAPPLASVRRAYSLYSHYRPAPQPLLSRLAYRLPAMATVAAAILVLVLLPAALIAASAVAPPGSALYPFRLTVEGFELRAAQTWKQIEGAAPGILPFRSDQPPGQGNVPPGQDKVPPGLSNDPGQANPPGQQKTAPGQVKPPPGQSNNPPGQLNSPPATKTPSPTKTPQDKGSQPSGPDNPPPGQDNQPPGQNKQPPGQDNQPPGQNKQPPGQSSQSTNTDNTTGGKK